MDLLAPLTPLAYYAVASSITIAALQRPRRARIVLLAPIWLFTLLSLASSHKISWPGGANSTFASMIVAYLPYSIKVLLEEHDVSPELSSQRWRLVDYYRTWNNPRKLQLRLSLLDKSEPCHAKARIMFALYQVAKATALWALDGYVFQKVLFRTFMHVMAADFSPPMELPTLAQAAQLSLRQIQVRALMSVQWIWSAYFFLEFYHCLLSVVFVALLRFDQPQDWPPLFGSLLEASSIRGFWGRFWHRLTIPTYLFYCQLITRSLLGVRPGSRLEKTLTPFIIFTMSGVSHSLVGWSLGDAGLARDVVFFELNFFAAALETAISKSMPNALDILPRSVRKPVGLVWVYVFFFCITPLWIYPKVYDSLVGLIP